MKSKLRKAMAAILAFMVVALALRYAGIARADTVAEEGKPGSIKICYLNSEGKAIKNAAFAARLVGEPVWNGTFRSLVSVPLDADADPREVAGLARGIEPVRAATNEWGLAYFTDLEQGLYLIEEETPADGYLASVPFFATIPYMKDGEWAYDLEADPKPLAAGSLRISKEVRGEDGEKDRKFRFKIVLGADGEFPVAYSTGEAGKVASGDTVELRHGEHATVSMIPPGTPYTVMELDADTDGYATAMTGEAGEISAQGLAEAAFVNTRGNVPSATPGCATCTPACATCTPACATSTPACATCTPVCATCTPDPSCRVTPTAPPVPPNVQTGDAPVMPAMFGIGILAAVVGAWMVYVGKRKRT